jgi:hypothetical protein
MAPAWYLSGAVHIRRSHSITKSVPIDSSRIPNVPSTSRPSVGTVRKTPSASQRRIANVKKRSQIRRGQDGTPSFSIAE